jgi:LacI family sucrose operon transcriptional repressor
MLFLRKQGVRIPEQVQIVGTGDTEKGHVVTPTLTTAHYYYRTSGKETARLMLGMLSGREPDRKSIKMGYKIIERESLRKPEDGQKAADVCEASETLV